MRLAAPPIGVIEGKRMSDVITRLVTEAQVDAFISRCYWDGDVQQWQRDGVRKILQDMPDAEPMRFHLYNTPCARDFGSTPCEPPTYKRTHYTCEEWEAFVDSQPGPKLRLVVDNTKP